MVGFRAWSRLAIVVAAACVAGCESAAKMLNETDRGGIVTYPYSGTGQLLSPFRQEAIHLIEQKCGKLYRIVREGETSSRQRVSAAVPGAEEVIRQSRWGIQFECRQPES